jgi:formate/nitrite transporter FocA (FNT family)
MKIRTRLSLLYLALTAAVLLGFAFIIYISAKNDREKGSTHAWNGGCNQG